MSEVTEVPKVNDQPLSELGPVAEYLYAEILKLRTELSELEVKTIQKRGQHEANVASLLKIQKEYKIPEA